MTGLLNIVSPPSTLWYGAGIMRLIARCHGIYGDCVCSDDHRFRADVNASAALYATGVLVLDDIGSRCRNVILSVA